MRAPPARWLLALLIAAPGCSADDPAGSSRRAPEAGPTEAAAGDASAVAPPDPDRDEPSWQPGDRVPGARTVRRGLVDLRGLVHEHSVYSHDACDDAPRDPATDAIDESCLADFREGLCAAAHDFIFLTDHPDSFARTPFDDALLHRAPLGDRWVERGGAHVASFAGCPDGTETLLLVGSESSRVMPVGLERHVGSDDAAREAAYSTLDAESIAALREAGAVVLVAHTESKSVEELTDLPVDGFEMYNLHANFASKLVEVGIPLLGEIGDPVKLMAPDLVVVPILYEDPRYLSTWGTVLARGARRVTTMGTDAHRNSLNVDLPDGERIDSWARMNRWFSNHLLVRPASDGSFDDRAVVDALRAGRLYGSFDVFGHPADFDFHAEVAGGTREMGEEVGASGATLVVRAPRVRRLDPEAPPPPIRLVLLRAVEGGFEEVASGSSELRHPVGLPGAYRAEVRITPHHLRDAFHSHRELADREAVWIYSNAIYAVD